MNKGNTREQLQSALENQRAVTQIMQMADVDTQLETILRETLRVLLSLHWLRDDARGAIFIANGGNTTPVLVACQGLDIAPGTPCNAAAFEHCLCQEAIRTASVVFDAGPDTDPDAVPQTGVRGHYAVPILDRDHGIVGALTLFVSAGHRRSVSEVEFLNIISRTLATIIARKQLEESRDSLARIVEEATCEIYEFDTQSFQFLRANRAASVNLGHSLDDLLSMTPVDLGLFESRQEMADAIAPMLEGSCPNISFHASQQRKDGSFYYVHASIQLLSHGKDQRFVAIINDITEPKKLLNLLHNAIDNFPGGISVINGDLVLELANSGFYSVLDLPEDRLPIGTHYADIIRFNAERGDYGDGDIETQVQERVDLAKQFVEHQLERSRPDGTIIEIRGTPLEGGGFVSTYVDVTRRKHAEREAIEARERLLNALEAVEEGFVLYDADDRMVLCNSKYREIYADSAEIMVPGASFTEIIRGGVECGQYMIPEGEEEEWIEQRLALHHSPIPRNAEQQLGNGRWVYVAEQRTPDGGSVGIRVDITERKLTELELESYRQNLEELVADRTMQVEMQAAQLVEALERETEVNQIQRQFVSMATHEFRTPLAIIDGAAQRLARRASRLQPGEIEERATKIRSSVKQMIGLMESALAAEKMDNGAFTTETEPCRIKDIIRSCVEQQCFVTPEASIKVKIDDMPDEIDGDAAALESVLNNLLSNAIKYSPRNPRVEISGGVGETILQICVSDNGIGIDADEIPKLFSRFFRARTSNGIPGTGIGLNLVKMIVEKHGGEIEVFSQKGKGSTFMVSLPIRQGMEGAEPVGKTIDEDNANAEAATG